MIKSIKLSIILSTVLVFVAMPFSLTFASEGNYLASDPQTLVCRGLAVVGIGCSSPAAPAPANYEFKPVRFNFDIFSNTPVANTQGSIDDSDVQGQINNSAAPRDLTGQKINLVSVPGSEDVYALVNGQKHIFPSLAIFYDYGYRFEMIQPISQAQLDKYPRAHLLKVEGSSNVYYLTEGGFVRLISKPKKIFQFYGDRKEDIITITRKEFNFYPTNQYVYQESPLNRDVFQISAEGKRYLTPMAVARRNILWNQVAPISQAELNFYKTLSPLLD